jgi:hypothetical protein
MSHLVIDLPSVTGTLIFLDLEIALMSHQVIDLPSVTGTLIFLDLEIALMSHLRARLHSC